MNIRSAAAMALTVISSAAFSATASAAERACGAGTCGKKTMPSTDASCAKKDSACGKKDASCSKQEASCAKKEASCSKR